MIYLDNAATSYPKPEAIKKELISCIETFGGNAGRGSHRLALLASEKIYECRSRICDYFGSSAPENVVFTYNATYALNMAIKSAYKRGSHILISDIEHNSVYRPVYSLKKTGECEFDIFSTDDDVVANIEKKIKKNTDMLICNHVSNVSGRVIPVEKIGQMCKKHGIYFILDASQSAGHLDINIEKIGCNVLCAPGHKGLFGIQGSGFALFSDRRHMRTFVEGGNGLNSRSPEMPYATPEAYESGTLSTPAIASLCAGISFIEQIGKEEIAEREETLRNFLFDRLSSIKGIIVQDADRKCTSTISFFSPKIKADVIGSALDEKGICARTGLHCSPLAHATLKSPSDGTVRASLSYFNTVKDIDVFTRTLKDIIK